RSRRGISSLLITVSIIGSRFRASAAMTIMEPRQTRLVLIGRSGATILAVPSGWAQRMGPFGTHGRFQTLKHEAALGGNVHGSVCTRGGRRGGFDRAGSPAAVAAVRAHRRKRPCRASRGGRD